MSISLIESGHPACIKLLTLLQFYFNARPTVVPTQFQLSQPPKAVSNEPSDGGMCVGRRPPCPPRIGPRCHRAFRHMQVAVALTNKLCIANLINERHCLGSLGPPAQPGGRQGRKGNHSPVRSRVMSEHPASDTGRSGDSSCEFAPA